MQWVSLGFKTNHQRMRMGVISISLSWWEVVCGCTHIVNKAHVPKLRENTALKGSPPDPAQRGSENRGEERNTTEFRGGKAKYNPHSQQCHWCCLCQTPRAEGRWAAKTNKSLEMLLGWWGGTPGSFCLQTEFQHPLTDDRKMSDQKRNHSARKWTREKD